MLAFDNGESHTQEDQLSNGSSLRSSLGFELAVQRSGDINRSSNSLFLHNRNYATDAINMERLLLGFKTFVQANQVIGLRVASRLGTGRKVEFGNER